LKKLAAGEKVNPFWIFGNNGGGVKRRLCSLPNVRSPGVSPRGWGDAGGLIVALADEAIAHAVMPQLSDQEGLTTIELKSNFLAGVQEGELIAEATVFKKGRSLVVGDCLVTDNKEKNVCRVSATFLILKRREEN